MAEMLPTAVPRIDLHQAIGGTSTWRRLSEAFYARVDRDPLLRPLFPGTTLHCAIEAFTAFLVQVFGGPAEDTQRRWWLSLRESHQRFQIGPKERAAWMDNMIKALEDAGIEEPFRGALREFFERSSAHVVNGGESALAAADPGSDSIRQEMSLCWEGQRALDAAVAAVRENNAENAIAAAENLRSRFGRDPSVLAGLLALMMGRGNIAMRRYVEGRLAGDPSLVRERYAGRTLLHQASAQGNLTIVEALLRLGADPNAQDGGYHTPLYSVANECQSPRGGDVVRALVKSGANVDARDGVKHCTALHVAARRGSVAIAEALLECGAEIDPRDSLGETPLRRSVNCNKIHVAALLLARGADARSIGSKGLTPLQAARSSAMKQLLGPRIPGDPGE